MSRLVIYDCNLTLDFCQGLPLDEWRQSLNADDIVVLRDLINSKHLAAHRRSADSPSAFVSFDRFFIPVWCSSRYADALKQFDSIMKYAEKYDLPMRIEIPLTDVSLQSYNLNPKWDHVDVFRHGSFFGSHDIEPTWYYQAVLGKMCVDVYPRALGETEQEREHFLDRMLVNFTTPRRDYFFVTNHISNVFERDLRGEFVGRRSRRSNKIPELQRFEGAFYIYIYITQTWWCEQKKRCVLLILLLRTTNDDEVMTY